MMRLLLTCQRLRITNLRNFLVDNFLSDISSSIGFDIDFGLRVNHGWVRDWLAERRLLFLKIK